MLTPTPSDDKPGSDSSSSAADDWDAARGSRLEYLHEVLETLREEERAAKEHEVRVARKAISDLGATLLFAIWIGGGLLGFTTYYLAIFVFDVTWFALPFAVDSAAATLAFLHFAVSDIITQFGLTRLQHLSLTGLLSALTFVAYYWYHSIR